MKKLLFVCALVALSLTGCRSKMALDENGNPRTLLVAVYEGDNPGEVSKALAYTQAYLSRKLGIPVEFQKSSDYSSVIEALLTKKVHMAYLSPFPYVLATQKQKLVPMVAPGMNGKPEMYHSLIFTNPFTGLHSMDDVKARSHSLTLCFADPASTSGHLVPAAYLASIGLDPKSAFKQAMFAGSHYASMLSVKSGKIDIGCSFNYSLDKMIREKMIAPQDLIVLWTSDPIVESPICMRSDINPAFTERVKNAYLRMNVEDTLAFRTYMNMYHPQHSDQLEYIPIQDSAFDGLRKIMQGNDITTEKQ
jgi:phosphonate transport system substrate-binding protein